MSQARARLALVAAAALALSGCQPPPITVEVALEGGEVVFSLFEAGWFGLPGAKGVCASAITVTARRSRRMDESDDVMWQTGMPNGQRCVDVVRFAYGTRPRQFTTTTPPRPLATGVIYCVDVQTTGQGERCFVLREPYADRVVELRPPA